MKKKKQRKNHGIGGFFFGTVGVSIPGDKKKILNFLEIRRTEYLSVSCDDNGVSLVLYRFAFRKLQKALDECGIGYTVTQERGARCVFLRLIRRPGMIAGLLLFVFSMIFFSTRVFDIKIVGNERLSDRYILDALENEGFSVGTRINDVDFDLLSNSLIKKYGDISWIFVNMRGNVAEVSVREYTEGRNENGNKSGVSDLVAKSAGQIYRFEISSGIVKVNIGDTVFPGQLLVSGQGNEERLYEGRSVGRVFAKVSESKNFIASARTSEKIEKGRELIKKSIKIFGKELVLFEKESTSGEICDIIDEERKLTLGDKAEMPVSLSERYAVTFEEREVILSKNEAKAEAEKLLSGYIGGLSDESCVLGMDRSDTFDGGSYMISCRFYLVRDIAREVAREVPPEMAR